MDHCIKTNEGWTRIQTEIIWKKGADIWEFLQYPFDKGAANVWTFLRLTKQNKWTVISNRKKKNNVSWEIFHIMYHFIFIPHPIFDQFDS